MGGDEGRVPDEVAGGIDAREADVAVAVGVFTAPRKVTAVGRATAIRSAPGGGGRCSR